MVGGTSNCLNAINFNKARLVIIAGDAGSIRRKVVRFCQEKGIQWLEWGTKDDFERILGSPFCVWAVLSEDFSRGIIKIIRSKPESKIKENGGD